MICCWLSKYAVRARHVGEPSHPDVVVCPRTFYCNVDILMKKRFPDVIQDDTKKRELLKNPTKIEEIKKKKLLTEIKPLQLALLETVIQIINV